MHLDKINPLALLTLRAQSKPLSVVALAVRNTNDAAHSTVLQRFLYDGTHVEPLPKVAGTIVARRPDGIDPRQPVWVTAAWRRGFWPARTASNRTA
jgi:hypothetical protein